MKNKELSYHKTGLEWVKVIIYSDLTQKTLDLERKITCGTGL